MLFHPMSIDPSKLQREFLGHIKQQHPDVMPAEDFSRSVAQDLERSEAKGLTLTTPISS